MQESLLTLVPGIQAADRAAAKDQGWKPRPGETVFVPKLKTNIKVQLKLGLYNPGFSMSLRLRACHHGILAAVRFAWFTQAPLRKKTCSFGLLCMMPASPQPVLPRQGHSFQSRARDLSFLVHVQVGSVRGGSIAFRRGMLTMTVRLEEVQPL